MVQVLFAENKVFEDKVKGTQTHYQDIGLFDAENKRMGKIKNYDMDHPIKAGDMVILEGYIKYDGSLGVTVKLTGADKK